MDAAISKFLGCSTSTKWCLSCTIIIIRVGGINFHVRPSLVKSVKVLGMGSGVRTSTPQQSGSGACSPKFCIKFILSETASGGF